MPTTIPTNSAIGRIFSLMEEINVTKQAAAQNGQTKSATELGLSGEGKQDPGGYIGKSDHPSARAASNVQKTPLGSRAKENEADVKKEHPGAGVDNTSAGGGGDQDSKQYNIGTHQSTTGDDPKVEDDYKSGKDDEREGDRGGTSHPAKAGDEGEKYSSYKFADLTKVAYAKMNEILADVANGQAVEDAPTKSAAATAQTAAATRQPTAAEKQAAAQAVIEQTILDARRNADLVGQYLTTYSEKYASLLKRAESAGQMGGGMEGEGGPPPEAAAAAGGPPPGAGGPPPGAGGGEGGPEGGLDEMINALLAMGMTPEDIEQALQAHMGGGGGAAAGGAPPGGDMAGAGAGGPPMGGGEMGKMGSARGLSEDQVMMLKAAHMASQRFRNGQWQVRPVQSGTKEAQERGELQRYILEVCGFRS